jgi:uncharacterized membrane protein
MKRLVTVIAVFEAFSLAVVLINVWFVAMLNGGSMRIAIDAYGEMWLEYVLWLVLTPVLVVGFYYALEELSVGQGG